MKRLHWYILKSFTGPFFMTFFIVVFVLLMQFLWKYVDDLVGKGLDFKVLFEMLFYASFGLLPLAFPLAMLLASIMTFGDLGENYELVAMKSSGISLFRIMKPLVIIAVFLTFLAFYFANYILPTTNLRFTTLLYSIKQQKPELVLQEGIFTNDIDGLSIKVGHKNKQTNTLHDLLIYDHRNNRVNENVTVADSGYLRFTEDKRYIVFNLYNGTNYSEDGMDNRNQEARYPFRRDNFQEQTIRVLVRDFEFNRRDESIFKNTYRMLNIKQLRLQEDTLGRDYNSRVRNFINQLYVNQSITKKLYYLTSQNDSLRKPPETEKDSIFNFDAYFNKLDKYVKRDILSNAVMAARTNMQNINIYQDQLYERKKLLNKHEMERHRKFTLSIAVFIFFLIGAPLGAIIRKGGLGMPVVVSIALFIFYYIISMTGEKSAREDVWEMVNGMWFSTYVFLPIGIWLTYKAVTDASVLNAEAYTRFLGKLKNFKLPWKK